MVYIKYYEVTWHCTHGGEYVRVYLIGMLILLSIIILVLIGLVNRSAQGSITDIEARKYVAPLLLFKLFLMLPEIVLNVFGTLWAFCSDFIVCPIDEQFSKGVIECKPFKFYLIESILIYLSNYFLSSGDI